jgi:hypothetical protein
MRAGRGSGIRSQRWSIVPPELEAGCLVFLLPAAIGFVVLVRSWQRTTFTLELSRSLYPFPLHFRSFRGPGNQNVSGGGAVLLPDPDARP